MAVKRVTSSKRDREKAKQSKREEKQKRKEERLRAVAVASKRCWLMWTKTVFFTPHQKV